MRALEEAAADGSKALEKVQARVRKMLQPYRFEEAAAPIP